MQLHDIEKELKELKVEIINKETMDNEKFLSTQVSVECDIDTEVDYSSIYGADYILKKHTGRKDTMYIEFIKSRDNTLTFVVSQIIPEKEVANAHLLKSEWNDLSREVGTTFPDLCWYHSEGTTSSTSDELLTKFRPDFNMGDLTWFLPSRFLENFIEIMHTLNQSILLGLMQEAIIYGPKFTTKKGATND